MNLYITTYLIPTFHINTLYINIKMHFQKYELSIYDNNNKSIRVYIV